jgi:hypothetical protein
VPRCRCSPRSPNRSLEELWANFNPKLVAERRRNAAGSWTDIDGEQLNGLAVSVMTLAEVAEGRTTAPILSLDSRTLIR